jgi:hypothetical protein
MRALTDDDLVLHYYGESPDADAVERALAASPALAERYRELCSVLDSVPELEVPEVDPAYGERVWRQLAPRIEEQQARKGLLARLFDWRPAVPFDRRWALAAAAVLLVVVSFLAGRFTSAPEASGPPPGQRILLVTVASHLERSELLLLELANARAAAGDGSETGDSLDVSLERLLARELSGANRLYRQAADKAGEQRVASVLDDLERLLLEIANAPDQLDAERLAELQARLDEADILFKIRVVGSRLDQRAGPDPDSSQSI